MTPRPGFPVKLDETRKPASGRAGPVKPLPASAPAKTLAAQPLAAKTQPAPARGAVAGKSLVHTVPAATACDYLPLDRRWTACLNSAADRMQRAGVRGKVGRAFAQPHLQEFIDHLVRDQSARSSH